MFNKTTRILAVAAVTLVVTAGCGSSSKSTNGNGTGSNGGDKTFTVGVLTDVTGIAASGNKTTVQGVQAGQVLARRAGYTIKYVVGDTTSSPSGALAAAQKLVQQDHVLAVIAVSALTFGAAAYLASHRVPVVGLGEDGNEWTQSPTMFSAFGALHPNVVTTAVGDFMKMHGVTSVAALGYSISPSSSEAAASDAKSAQDAGLKVGYLNTNFPFGSTNVGPEVIAMKNAGVDALNPIVDPDTGFALVSGLRQQGDNLKVALLPTGYGGDLLQAGPGALQSAQGVYFESTFEPVEVHDAATQQFQSDLKAIGVNSDPTFGEYGGYTSVGLLVQALQGAGSSVTQGSLVAALSGIHNWTAMGLFGGRSLDINNRAAASGSAANCLWIVKLSGNGFALVPGADPICGPPTGQTVSPSS